MERSIILNFKVLDEVDLSIAEFLYLCSIYLEKDIDIKDIDLEKLQEKKLIKTNKEIITLRQKSIDLIELCLIESDISIKETKKIIKKSKRAIDNDILNRIQEYRCKWKGLKPGSMGSLKTCAVKLTRWMKENPDYSFDDILKAADLYIKTEGSNTRYLQRADYFIFKQESNKEESSRLSAFIEEIDDFSQEDWTTQLN